MHRLVIALTLMVVLSASACSAPGECARTVSTPQPVGSSQAVLVPDVTGMKTSAADTALQSLGLLLIVEPVGGNDQIIQCQSPPPEARVGRGSVVFVEARCYPAPCPFPGEGKTIYDPCTCAAR